jgi:hypothetical protein
VEDDISDSDHKGSENINVFRNKYAQLKKL